MVGEASQPPNEASGETATVLSASAGAPPATPASSDAAQDPTVESESSLSDEPELRRSLLLEEYKAIRAKSAEARNNQQTIIQWSLAVAGLVVAGVITGARDNTTAYRLAVAFVMCTAVPLILLSALGVWLSEVNRMLRAAQYLRARENAFATGKWQLAEDEYFTKLPIVWETLLATSDNYKGKAELGYVSVILMYSSLILGANAVGEWLLWNLDKWSPFFMPVAIFGTIASLVIWGLLLRRAWKLRSHGLT